MTVEELIKLLSEEAEGYPRADLTLPMHISKRPMF
ncbi:MAG: hypothetical protein QXW94_00285, partial [Desulfurococcaceae archaeon]